MAVTTREALECAMRIIEKRKKGQQEIYDFNIKAITMDAESANTHLDDIAGDVRRAKEAEVLLKEYGTMLSLLRDIIDIYEKEVQK